MLSAYACNFTITAYADNSSAGTTGDDHMTGKTEPALRGMDSRCHCTALRKASRRISQLYDVALAPSGLKTTQRAILAQIGRSQPDDGRCAGRGAGDGCRRPRAHTEAAHSRWAGRNRRRSAGPAQPADPVDISAGKGNSGNPTSCGKPRRKASRRASAASAPEPCAKRCDCWCRTNLPKISRFPWLRDAAKVQRSTAQPASQEIAGPYRELHLFPIY